MKIEMKNPGIFIIVGIAAIIIGVLLTVRGNHKTQRCTQKTYAVVIDYEETEESDSDGNWYTMYSPIIRYNANGQMITVKSPSSYSYKKYKTNTEFEILYNPNKVEEYIVPSDNNTKLISIIMIVLGVVSTIAGIAGSTYSYLEKE